MHFYEILFALLKRIVTLNNLRQFVKLMKIYFSGNRRSVAVDKIIMKIICATIVLQCNLFYGSLPKKCYN